MRSKQYTGKRRPQSGERTAPYLPADELVEAVNIALFLERPLLLRGEPGTGKTRLARAVADELGLPLESWHVKSTTKAKDGLYSYDHLARLRDVQLATSRRDSDWQDDAAAYVRWGPLARAFRGDRKTVLLIDEIDKADIDFPNDLLLELDELRFSVQETGETVQAKVAPLVVITSNDEKDLPDAFLRRCLFHFIQFPSPDRLEKIVRAHFPELKPAFVNAALQKFVELREKMVADRSHSGKRASTSELIDWFRVLSRHPHDEALKLLQGQLPYPSVLLKLWEDHVRYLTEEHSS